MGKVTFTSLQESIFEKFSKSKFLCKKFYFTGGTVLAAFYLHHRESEDLDFFSEKDFENKNIDKFVDQIAGALKSELRFTQIEDTRIYELFRGNKLLIKIDFNYYPYKRLKGGLKIQGVAVDSIYDIAVNKLQTIISRTQVKDFVDLYFLLKQFTLWDLLYGIKKKFKMDEDIVLLGSNFLKVEEFDVLPKMLVPLDLIELKKFFKNLAETVGMKVVKK